MRNEAMVGHGPGWLSIWMPILFAGAFVLPLALLIWKPTRLTAGICVAASILRALSTNLLYEKMGYVRLLGLPHSVFWTPLMIYLFTMMRKPTVGQVAKVIMAIASVVILISLVFDYRDVIRYLLGERAAAS